jgi:hypothetical protein
MVRKEENDSHRHYHPDHGEPPSLTLRRGAWSIWATEAMRPSCSFTDSSTCRKNHGCQGPLAHRVVLVVVVIIVIPDTEICHADKDCHHQHEWLHAPHRRRS